ncbi:hypothetical protein MKZ38_003134 [Zalerion maritima]|uniref:Uncharacterized protein n=1 Tax=Zalerion maritima TaxID=339359 RepID=A0AAD5RX00_9PEZI|nr:hypothetical protein MKZ38_003134 [Zalerion maritima]
MLEQEPPVRDNPSLWTSKWKCLSVSGDGELTRAKKSQAVEGLCPLQYATPCGGYRPIRTGCYFKSLCTVTNCSGPDDVVQGYKPCLAAQPAPARSWQGSYHDLFPIFLCGPSHDPTFGQTRDRRPSLKHFEDTTSPPPLSLASRAQFSLRATPTTRILTFPLDAPNTCHVDNPVSHTPTYPSQLLRTFPVDRELAVSPNAQLHTPHRSSFLGNANANVTNLLDPEHFPTPSPTSNGQLKRNPASKLLSIF